MKRISSLAERIREHTYKWNSDLYEHSYKDHSDEWSALCVAMDTLDDTGIALEYFEGQGLGKDDGEKYLKLYGLLQGIFLQQDSIRQLHRELGGQELTPSPDTGWMKIRELRNVTVGHPINSNGNKSCLISRVTIGKNGFQVIVWNKAKKANEIETTNFNLLYEHYKSGAIIHLESIYKAETIKWPRKRSV
jgi:hypothetical protein